jgi:tRNA(Ile)-lysidine synthetase-like protein
VRRARPDLALRLTYVAHGLRTGALDRAESERVARLAARLGATSTERHVTVTRAGEGLEAAARDARHAALEDEAHRADGVAVLLGHHADDQAETVLLRLARGTGPEGLAGMAAVAGLRVRPLLDVRRVDAHRAADDVAPGVLADAAHDPMNDDDVHARVRVRRDLLPALAAVGPDPVGALTRLASLVRDESAVIDAALAELLPALGTVRVGHAIAVPSAALRALPAGLARRALRGVLPRLEADALERFLRAPDGWRATLPGPLEAEVGRGWHVVAPTGASAPAEAAVVTIDAGAPELHLLSGITVVATRAHADGHADRRADRRADQHADGHAEGSVSLVARPAGAVPPGLRMERLAVRLRAAGPLRLRTRRDGDRVRTPGGTRTLADVMAEAGVPVLLRELLPVLVDAADRPLWVPGLVVEEHVHDRDAAPPE